MLHFASLGSGSKGNATLIRSETTVLLVDCGFSVRETTRRLARLALTPNDINAILVTHEHSDHGSGVAALARKFDLPVYLTHGTACHRLFEGCDHLKPFEHHSPFTLGDILVQPVPVPHDAREPSQFVFECGDVKLGVLTDLGCITPWVRECYQDCDALLLECNHDEQMLRAGPYPPALKRRVGGDWGHLSNRQAAQLLQTLDLARLRELVVAHISEANNARSEVESVLSDVLPQTTSVTWASQSSGFDWLSLDDADAADSRSRRAACQASI